MEVDNQLARTLDQLFATSPDLVFVQDRRGRFTYVNQAGAEALGFEQVYFLGKTWNDLSLAAAIRIKLAADFVSTFATGQRCAGEVAIPTVLETKDYKYVLSPIYADSKIEQAVLIAQDVTEQKRAEIALRESEEKYRYLFEAANDLILIADASTYRILDANRSAARQLGYTRGELFQISIYAIEVPMPASRRAVIFQQLETKGSYTYEHCYRCKDGTEIPVEINTQMIEYDRLLAFQSFARDITERKKAEAKIYALNVHLEQRVLERTAELNKAYDELSSEVAERRKAEIALRDQQAFLRSVIDTCPDLIAVKDWDGRYVLANRAAAELYRTTPEQLIGKRNADLRPHLIEKQSFVEINREVMSSLQPRFIREQQVFDRFSDEVRWFQTTIKPLLLSEEKADHVLVVATDITQRKQIEEALQASESRYRAIVEDQTELVCRFLADGTLTFVNDAYCRMLKLSRAELLDQGHKMFLLVLDPDVATKLMTPLTVEQPVCQAEYQVMLPDGMVRWQQWNNRAIFDQQGQLIEFQAVGVDITERKQIESSLRESEAQFRILFEQAAVGMAQIALTGQFLQVNRRFCKIVGYTEAALLAQTSRSITHPEDLEAELESVQLLLINQVPVVSFEKRYLRQAGQVQWVNVTASLIRDVSGQPQSFLMVIAAKEEAQGQPRECFCNPGSVQSDSSSMPIDD